MMRREYFLRPRLPFAARPAPYLPLYLARPRLLLPPRPRPLFLRRLNHAGFLPFLHAGEMPPSLPVPYARPPPQMPSRNSRSLKVVKAPFKPSRSQNAPKSSSAKGRSRKLPFEANKKKLMKGKAAVARPRMMAPTSFDLVEEVRALHALWWAGPAVSHINVARAGPAVSPTDVARPGLALTVAPKGKMKLETLELVRRADLLAEVRALHDLWRAGPGVTQSNARTLRKRKPEPTLGPKGENSGPPVAVKRKVGALSNSGKTFKRPQKKRARKDKKSARKTSLRDHEEPHAPIQLSATAFRSQLSHDVEPDDSSEDDEPNANLTRNSNVPLEAKEEVKFAMLTPGRRVNEFLSFEHGGAAGTQVNESSNFGDDGTESQYLTPKKEVISERPEELQNDVFEQAMEFLNSVGGGIESEQLTPNQEKEREDGSFHFFSGLFRENAALRSLYARPGNGSTIDCLVCHSLGESKGFDKVLSLVMHATSRVKRRPEHRGYGRAVSAIVGWNSNRAL